MLKFTTSIFAFGALLKKKGSEEVGLQDTAFGECDMMQQLKKNKKGKKKLHFEIAFG